jgi:hypothetical protein
MPNGLFVFCPDTESGFERICAFYFKTMILCKISASDGGEYGDESLLAYSAM